MTTSIFTDTILDYEHSATDGGNFSIARFRAMIPEGVKPEGVLVIVPGSSGDAREDVKWVGFVNFAVKERVALVGCNFVDKVGKIDEDYVDVKGGSGEALIVALTQFGLDRLPIFLYGFSAGGEYNFEFACQYPERVAGFIVNKGGVYYTALAPKATRCIPALFFTGKRDAGFRQDIIKGIYQMNYVVHNAKDFGWRLFEENTGHSEGRSLDMSLAFFGTVLNGN